MSPQECISIEPGLLILQLHLVSKIVLFTSILIRATSLGRYNWCDWMDREKCYTDHL